MKVTIDNLQDNFKIGFEAFETSRNEYREIRDMYHNRMFTQEQLNVLNNRGQPAESYNVIKTYSRKFVGYFSSTMSSIKAIPVQPDDAPQASLLTDTAESVLDDNEWGTKADILTLDLLLAGVRCEYIVPEQIEGEDGMGRPFYSITVDRIAPEELVFDPMAKMLNNSDARYISRYKWVSEDEFTWLFGKRKMNTVQANYNPTEMDGDAEFDLYEYGFTGRYRIQDNYLVIHTVMLDEKQNWVSVYWHDRTILQKDKVEKNPYNVTFLNETDRPEYYGVFREIAEPQKSINQAIIQIQQMVNTTKVFVEEDAIKDLPKFTDLVNRVNAVIPVSYLEGLKIEDMSRNVADQYLVIDRNLERIQSLLAINDSFLGEAAASDSGRKVKLQQNASIVALRYLTNRVESCYTQLGKTIFYLISKYYTANQIFSVSALGSAEERKFFEVNRPFEMPDGQGGIEPVYDVSDELDANGERGYTVVNESASDLGLTEIKVKVLVSQYNENDDMERVFLDSLVQGPAGLALQNASPAHYFRLLALHTESAKTRHSYQIAQIFKDMADKMEGKAPTEDPRQFPGAGGAQAPQGDASQQPGGMMHASGVTNMGVQ